MSRSLTRQQFLEWNPKWSVDDKALIDAALDALPEKDYYCPNSNAYASARVSGRRVLWAAPGYIVWEVAVYAEAIAAELLPRGLSGGPPDHKEHWFSLSTFQARGSSAATPTFEELRAPCPRCFEVPSVSGTCSCD